VTALSAENYWAAGFVSAEVGIEEAVAVALRALTRVAEAVGDTKGRANIQAGLVIHRMKTEGWDSTQLPWVAAGHFEVVPASLHSRRRLVETVGGRMSLKRVWAENMAVELVGTSM